MNQICVRFQIPILCNWPADHADGIIARRADQVSNIAELYQKDNVKCQLLSVSVRAKDWLLVFHPEDNVEVNSPRRHANRRSAEEVCEWWVYWILYRAVTHKPRRRSTMKEKGLLKSEEWMRLRKWFPVRNGFSFHASSSSSSAVQSMLGWGWVAKSSAVWGGREWIKLEKKYITRCCFISGGIVLFLHK